MRRIVRRLTIGVFTAALMLPGAVHAITLSDFTYLNSLFAPGGVNVGNQPDYLGFLNFAAIPIDSPPDYADDLDFGVAVWAFEGGDVFFEFVNASDITSVITSIYFDDGTRTTGGGPNQVVPAPAFIENPFIVDESMALVDFSVGSGVTPPDLPEGDDVSPEFVANRSLSAYAVNPSTTWGLSETPEYLVLSYDAVVSLPDIFTAFGTGDLRIGLMAQSINGGPSDHFIGTPLDIPLPPDPNDPGGPIPEPTTMVLLGMGSFFLAARRRIGNR